MTAAGSRRRRDRSRRGRVRRAIARWLEAGGLAALVFGTPAIASRAEPGWQRWDLGTRQPDELSQSSALARSPRGDVAIGDASGVSWRTLPAPHAGVRASPATQRVALPGVRDLAFDADGVLWIAGDTGLHRWSGDDRPVRRPLRGAEGDPSIRDLDVSGSGLLVASATGAYWSTSGGIFQPLAGGEGVAGSVSRVLLRAASDDEAAGPGEIVPGEPAEAWLLGTNQLQVVRGRVTPSGLRVTDRERLALPRPGLGSGSGSGSGSENGVVAMALDARGDQLVLVYPDALAIRALDPVGSHVRSDPGWRIERPVLAPGARARALVWSPGAVLIATDHGVFAASGPAGPFRRVPNPAGTEACHALEIVRGGRGHDSARGLVHDYVLALCRSGLYRFAADASSVGSSFVSPIAAPRTEPSADRRAVEDGEGVQDTRSVSLAPDPPVEVIRQRALARAGLDAEQAARLWSGLRRRARWPELELRLAAGFDDDEQRDHDQTFVSGDTRQLYDRGRDRGRSLDATIVFDWDLGGLVYPLEAVDLSRELRQVVSLRDDIADEINQLYFERQRLRAALATGEPREAAEHARMLWRAREIDAGLDAWTGGWIARWRRDAQAASREAPSP